MIHLTSRVSNFFGGLGYLLQWGCFSRLRKEDKIVLMIAIVRDAVVKKQLSRQKRDEGTLLQNFGKSANQPQRSVSICCTDT